MRITGMNYTYIFEFKSFNLPMILSSWWMWEVSKETRRRHALTALTYRHACPRQWNTNAQGYALTKCLMMPTTKKRRCVGYLEKMLSIFGLKLFKPESHHYLKETTDHEYNTSHIFWRCFTFRMLSFTTYCFNQRIHSDLVCECNRDSSPISKLQSVGVSSNWVSLGS